MDKRIIAQIERNNRCVSVFNSYPEQCAQVPALKMTVDGFCELGKETEELLVEIEEIGLKTSLGKSMLWDRLIDIDTKVGKLAFTFADETKDTDVLENIITSPSSLKRKKSYELVVYNKWFCPYIDANAEKLVDYGVSTEMIAVLKKLSEEAVELEQEPREKINERKEFQIKLKGNLKQMNNILATKIDNLMAVFAEDDPFYVAYFSARTLIKPQTFHRSEEEGEED